MGIRCGIVGLPNAGKSTLFNALTASDGAQVGSFPFSTIEPTTGRVEVPDPRLDRIAALDKPRKVTRNHVEFVDIAGLVRGANRGEGLGNRFLGEIREVDALVHVVRCFGDGAVGHVDGSLDPLRDVETVETELMLADMESVERRQEAASRRAKGGDREARAALPAMERALAALHRGMPAHSADVPADEARRFALLQLLTAKPVLYVCNVDEESGAAANAHAAAVARHAERLGAACVAVSARIESDLAHIADADERAAFLEDLGFGEPGLHRVIRAAYDLLGLITFFTAGPKEARAWAVADGATARQAAGRIHSDFERGFICAETVGYDDFVACGGEQGARSTGRMRREGRDYRVRDGDILLFRFNV